MKPNSPAEVRSEVVPFMTEERSALQEMARDFAMREVLPIANELDPVAGEIPMELRRKMADLGFFGILVPEEYGGLGLGLSEYAVIVEELARAWMSVASLIARGQQFTAGFDAEQRREFLPRIARGEFLSAFALSEPDAGSDVANLSCRATPDGDGWRITGQKMWCTFADGADYLQVFARTSPADPSRKARGISCFMMPKQRGQLPDGVRGTPIRKIGYHGWKTWELSFENAYAETMIGAEGEGFKVAMGDLDTARVHTAARAIGLARGALEDATAYAKQRVQFGRPIAQNQAIRFRIADMATQVAAARSLMFQVCTEVDAGRTSPVSASMVKLFASEMAEKVTSDALQIHGGSGYTTDFPVERYWRDARLTKPEAGLRPWSTFVVNAAAGGLDLQQSATGLGGQAEATVAVGSGAVHTIVVGGAGESIRSAKLCLPGPAVGAATATGRAARRRTRTRRSPARAEAAGPRGCWAPTCCSSAVAAAPPTIRAQAGAPVAAQARPTPIPTSSGTGKGARRPTRAQAARESPPAAAAPASTTRHGPRTTAHRERAGATVCPHNVEWTETWTRPNRSEPARVGALSGVAG